ncbi:XdhC family protein [Aquimarina sp. D1M17]|uniref:XdhC family protein n=1 Tax=Aquimarina acroporae TaxID=2937283 RepID=UPI0020BFAFF4|nr:XdhC/CoxI family protein [Aquimarina acroporae]MCK8520646.1 XdhC family protein [Aquimarina acroporae]
MTHEFKEIIQTYWVAKQQGIPAVMATVVDVEGSSYRRPGVGMLILENGKAVGAVSGGCVEKEVLRQAQSVFESGIPKIMTYDGKYRLGCEGLLYILIERLDIENVVIEHIQEHLTCRVPFTLTSFYTKNSQKDCNIGSLIVFENGQEFTFNYATDLKINDDVLLNFSREMKPCFRLIIIGSEHDATQLCRLASSTGWEVEVVCSEKSTMQLEDFPGANKLISSSPEDLQLPNVDDQTAVILMTHNFARDLLYLQSIRNLQPIYIGLLGPARRREKLLSAFIEYHPDVNDEFIDCIHGPAGLNLGAETPQEIAISIIAEILSVIRNQNPIPLQDKKGAIHDDVNRKSIHV